MIYKYYSINKYSKLVLETGEIWAANPREFNDPFDSLVTLKFSKDEVTNLFKEWAARKAICCFSRNFRNILMWSHYANNHKGFCIGIYHPELENSGLLADVIYSKYFLDVNEDNFLKIDSEKGFNQDWDKILNHKFLDWSYEEEIRLILELDNCSSKGKSFLIGSQTITKIFFGLCMNDEDKKMLKDIMQHRTCIFYQMELSDASFALDAKVV